MEWNIMGQIDRQIYGWIDGQIDRYMDGWIDGWMDRFWRLQGYLMKYTGDIHADIPSGVMW